MAYLTTAPTSSLSTEEIAKQKQGATKRQETHRVGRKRADSQSLFSPTETRIIYIYSLIYHDAPNRTLKICHSTKNNRNYRMINPTNHSNLRNSNCYCNHASCVI